MANELRELDSREYKVMLRPRWFSKRRAALDSLLLDLHGRADHAQATVSGEWEVPERQVIRFLDTRDFALRDHALLLRRRDVEGTGQTEFTLKCRSADRFFAAGQDLQPGPGLTAEVKLEEDIAAAFLGRTSHSSTITIPTAELNDNEPDTLEAAAQLFPRLSGLQRDGLPAAPHTQLLTVNGMRPHERVFKGVKFKFAGISAKVAVIVWTQGWEGRPLAAEFSFRHKSKDGPFTADTSAAARALFLAIQHLDWCATNSLTKTQFVYGATTNVD